MENIFENAKFRDVFVTEDGDLAIFFKHRDENSNFLLLEHSGGICYVYDDNGRCLENPEWHCNIVSKYKEPIDEEKLNKLANEQVVYENTNMISIEMGIYDAFVAGYRKAKES